jgi:hypothetical protein
VRILREIDSREVFGAIQAFMNQCHRVHTIFHVLKNPHGSLIVGMSGLEVEKAADHREVIFDAMMDFAQKSLLAFLAGTQLSGHPFRDLLLLDQCQNARHHEGKHHCRGERCGYSKNLTVADRT